VFNFAVSSLSLTSLTDKEARCILERFLLPIFPTIAADGDVLGVLPVKVECFATFADFPQGVN